MGVTGEFNHLNYYWYIKGLLHDLEGGQHTPKGTWGF